MLDKAVKTATVFAPAKVNLTLHITGQRDDGYHLIDSLVVFGSVGDDLTIEPAQRVSLTVTGPEAAGLSAGSDNLVTRTAQIFPPDLGAHITLTKNLPSASGIGGGSADAAAAFRGLMAFWGGDTPTDVLSETLEDEAAALMQLGADIPMCLFSSPCRARGIGEIVDPVAGLPRVWAVLVNPRVSLSTPKIFYLLEKKDNPPMPDVLPDFKKPADLADWMSEHRNDLEPPARSAAPVIGQVLSSLRATESCLIARMSGSGATCFGLYPNKTAAKKAAKAIGEQHKTWWVKLCSLGDQHADAMPKTTAEA
ncbi:4-(cytidine 5'-diphospho)-2-C-methyl-D-erythritol kinase [Pseudaestuariivita rosea]|uniref:4-(cytidine 5'-diphospho)-2-C-methyl-D-erythritol kinase n=1 Tax=Pseudaestuariivita rosea TaxID=2763263 RepID=UPI001ABAEF2C|nr:4-(cytidine 5'-diphospho)-2-C-methyl-D-erythritol kinase [Pseudaestuariivita rosea]